MIFKFDTEARIEFQCEADDQEAAIETFKDHLKNDCFSGLEITVNNYLPDYKSKEEIIYKGIN